MQDHYAGDIGDYVKLALLRKLGSGRRLGVAWYLYPDEPRDGGHINYLNNPRWQHLDPDLFVALRHVVDQGRSVDALERTGMLNAIFSHELLISADLKASERDVYRKKWFGRVVRDLENCDLIFADPDNGLADDRPQLRRQKKFGKRMPLSEAKALAEGKTAIIYHHNTRFRGGHEPEIQYWLQLFGDKSFAVRVRAYGCRTFFILNSDNNIRGLAIAFCRQWSEHGVQFVDCVNSVSLRTS
jgi:hypothetical protein